MTVAFCQCIVQTGEAIVGHLAWLGVILTISAELQSYF